MSKLLDKDVFRKRTVKVIFEDGNSYVTSINGTVDEITNFYVGNIFNLGTIGDDLVEAVGIEFLE